MNIGKETDARAAAEFKWAGQCIRNYETEVYRINCESNGVYGKFCRVSVKTF